GSVCARRGRRAVARPRGIDRSMRACLLGLVLLSGCAPFMRRSPYTIIQSERRTPAPSFDVSQAEWTLSRERLARLREAQPDKPYTERVRVAILDPRNGKTYEARGAVAVSPSH